MIKNAPSFSIIVPVHKGPDLIINAVTEIYDFLSHNFSDFEIILIDSGIGVAPTFCDSLAKKHEKIRVIRDTVNTQFGAKLKIGYREAKKDLVWLIPLDIPFSLEYGLKVIPLLDRFDCVFSYRISDSRGLWRRIQTRVYNFLTYRVLGLKVKNINSQFRIFKTRVVQRLSLLSDGWFIDAEVLYYITRLDIPYTEIPIPIIERKNIKSSVSPFAFLGVLQEAFYFFQHKKM